jgi:hypothetical protein
MADAFTAARGMDGRRPNRRTLAPAVGPKRDTSESATRGKAYVQLEGDGLSVQEGVGVEETVPVAELDWHDCSTSQMHGGGAGQPVTVWDGVLVDDWLLEGDMLDVCEALLVVLAVWLGVPVGDGGGVGTCDSDGLIVGVGLREILLVALEAAVWVAVPVDDELPEFVAEDELVCVSLTVDVLDSVSVSVPAEKQRSNSKHFG